MINYFRVAEKGLHNSLITAEIVFIVLLLVLVHRTLLTTHGYTAPTDAEK